MFKQKLFGLMTFLTFKDFHIAMLSKKKESPSDQIANFLEIWTAYVRDFTLIITKFNSF